MVANNCWQRSESDSAKLNTRHSGHKCLCQTCNHNITRFEAWILPSANFFWEFNVGSERNGIVSFIQSRWSKHPWWLKRVKTWSFRARVCLDKLTLLLLQQQWFHGHAQTMLLDSPKMGPIYWQRPHLVQRVCNAGSKCVSRQRFNLCLQRSSLPPFGGLFLRFCCPFWSLCRKWERRVRSWHVQVASRSGGGNW